MSDDTATMNGCTLSIALLAAAILAVPYQGWALWLLWNWFAVPMAPAITWHSAVGVMVLVGFFKMKPVLKKNQPESKSEEFGQFLTYQFAVLLAVGIGWGFHAVGFGAVP